MKQRPETLLNLGRCAGCLLRSEEGQDLVEYALLTAFIGFAGAGAVSLVLEAMRVGYGAWDTNNQNLWEPAAPSGT